MAYRLIFLSLFVFFTGAVGTAQQKDLPVASKISAALSRHLYHAELSDSIDVIVVKKSKPVYDAAYRVLQGYNNTFVIRLPARKVSAVVADSNTLFADLVKAPKEELTTGSLDLAVNTLNAAHAHFPTITGTGIVASIKEQRFDTTDIDYANRYVNTAAAAPTTSTHAAIMATTLAGAGNSSPFARGAAPGAQVTSTSFVSLLPEADAYYKDFKISIQNHSYGTVPENYYGAEAAAYDQSVVVNPTLVHVFSAGNSGTATGTGPYAGLSGWANLTGNFKTAKNVIVVGATDSFYQVATASSKGPAFDGRIKPELVAFGEDGSSGAAALTSGTVALLQQAYQKSYQRLPSAALMKAVLLNSADDVGLKGIDYASGYGRLNGYKAVKTILENRFLEDSITHGGLKKFTLPVPPNTAQLKVTLAWTDQPAPVNSPTALVNDLDVTLENSAGTVWLPWVLNRVATIDSITKLATRQRDTLNNVEQITVNAPVPGVYTLQIRGSRIVSGVQGFALAYQFDTTAFEWTFPTKDDPVVAGRTAVLRWQSIDTTTGTIEYTLNGDNWQSLWDTISLKQGYFIWNVPDTFTTARLRMRFLNSLPVVSDTFVISKAATVQVGFNCTDSVMLFWNPLPVAQYQIYNLSAGTLQPVSSTPDTTFIFKTATHQSTYYAVAPLINGKEGLRSFTIDYTTQGTACYFRSFYEQAQDDHSATFAALLGTTYNIDAVSLQKLQNNQFVTLQTINRPTTTDLRFTDDQLTEGSNRYRLQIVLHNGTVLWSDAISIFYFSKAVVFIYPNPVRRGQAVTIRTNTGEHIRLRLFNTTGALIRKTELNSIGTSMPTIDLPAGIYLMEAQKDDGTRRTQKLVVY